MNPAFSLLRRHGLPHLGIEFQEYEHTLTGGRHIHLACEHEENVFLVGFRTMPMNSSGVAHVLEHTSLCGSERFPVRDPFFMMIRRSLNTFMNAFTAGDWTAYPFATQNDQDFFNLFDVYMDAVFHPRLDPLDFAQEGIRREWEEDAAGQRQLVYKGVVFNEMKGAMSSPSSFFYEAMNRHLFPSTTYHYNSGGDPACIPQLTHADLLRFHAEHYHPSNAIFMSFGRLPVTQIQDRLQTCLQAYQAPGHRVRGRDEQRYVASLRVEEAYPVQESDLSRKSCTILGWLLGHSFDVAHSLDMSLMSGLLLTHAASPLRYALESSELGLMPSQLCGLQQESREMVFIAGLEGSEPEHAAAIETMILQVLSDVAEQGFARESIDAVLHRIELRERIIGGDNFPYGLSLLLDLLSPALQDADVLPHLDLGAALDDLRQRAADPAFVPGLIRRHLLDNQHRVRLTLRADADYEERAQALEQAALAQYAAALDAPAAAALEQAASALAQRQAQVDDPDVLPRVGRSDIPSHPSADPSLQERTLASGLSLLSGQAASNGVIDQRLLLAMPDFSAAQLPWLALYTDVLPDLGAGERDYLQQQTRIAAYTGGISVAPIMAAGEIAGLESLRGVLALRGRALARNQSALTDIMFEQFEGLRFDEHARLRERIEQAHESARSHAAAAGHVLAKQQAGRDFSALAAWQAESSAPDYLLFLRRLYEGLRDHPTSIEEIAAHLQEIHRAMLSQPRQLHWAGEATADEALLASLSAWRQPSPWTLQEHAPARRASPRRQVWLAATQVQFCVEAYPSVHTLHPDYAALSLLASILRNAYLHRFLREQGGAYGGGASVSGDDGVFYFYSYRDPRLEATYTDFARARTDLQRDGVTPRQIEEALLAAMARLDKPASPAGEVLTASLRLSFGVDYPRRERMRQALLAVTPDDVLRVNASYLVEERARRVAIIAPAHEQEARQCGYDLESLL